MRRHVTSSLYPTGRSAVRLYNVIGYVLRDVFVTPCDKWGFMFEGVGRPVWMFFCCSYFGYYVHTCSLVQSLPRYIPWNVASSPSYAAVSVILLFDQLVALFPGPFLMHCIAYPI